MRNRDFVFIILATMIVAMALIAFMGLVVALVIKAVL